MRTGGKSSRRIDAVNVGGPCSIEGCKRQHMYNSPVCYKHKGQKPPPPPPPPKKKPVTETNRPSGEDLWWTEEDETQRCDDDPEVHYGVCEFDSYDGICFHCKNMVHPDIHLIHLINNDRTSFLNFESSLVEGEHWARNYRSRLPDIWEEFIERDIMFEAQLGYGASRAEALQQLCYADKEHILSVVKENLSKAGAPTEGEGTAPWVWNSFEAELNSHFERIRDWDIERVDWSPEDWGLEKPPTRRSASSEPYDEDDHPFPRAIGVFLMAAYVFYVLEEGLLYAFGGTEGKMAEFLCFVFLVPPYIIWSALIQSGNLRR